MGDKALDLPARSRFGECSAQPSNREPQGLQGHEGIDYLVTRTIPFNIKRAHSKALESGCLFRFPRLHSIMTQSLTGEPFLSKDWKNKNQTFRSTFGSPWFPPSRV